MVGLLVFEPQSGNQVWPALFIPLPQLARLASTEQLRRYRLNRIGRVDGLADRRWIVEQRDDVGPFGPPLLRNRRILLVPGLSKSVERLLRFDDGRGLIDF